MIPSKKTIYEFLTEYAQLSPDEAVLFNEEISYSAKELKFTVENLANTLFGQGIKAGDFVAIPAERNIYTVIKFFAVQILGAVAVMIDVHENPLKALEKNKVEVKLILTDVPKRYARQEELLFSPIRDSSKSTIVIFTSGSTGTNKAVLISQYAFINNSYDTRDIGDYRRHDISMAVLPFHHVFALAQIITALVTQHSIFIPSGTETEAFLSAIEKYRVTRMNGVPSLYLSMVKIAEKYDIASLRCGLIGGAPLSVKEFCEIEARLGMNLIPVYGMSECIGISCADYRDPVQRRANSVGKIYSMNKLKIVDDDGRELSPGASGEIHVKSPAFMNGYLDETEDVTDGDGFFATGDLGYLDEEGYLHINGRKKDIIIRNGNNLSTAIIEGKIKSLPFVIDAAVVGIHDEAVGEIPAAAIVTAEGTEIDEIFVKLREVLSKQEMPARIVRLKEIPLTSSGKADKQKIKTMFIKKCV